MAELRTTVIAKIQTKVDMNKSFSIDDFSFGFPDDSNQLATINFRASSKYYFYIEENTVNHGIYDVAMSLSNKKRETVLQTVISPGDYKNQQTINHKNIDECIEYIPNWLTSLEEDLKNSYVERDNIFDDFQKKLDEDFPDADEVFTIEEKDDILEKLNQMQERIKNLEEDNKLSEEEATKTNEVIEVSKENLKTYPKKAWYLTTWNRLKNVNDISKIAIELKSNISNILEWLPS